MAAPSYGTDLIDLSLAESTAGMTGTGAGGSITAETDFFIQGSFCISKATQASWRSNARGGCMYTAGAGITVPSPGGVFVWMYWWGPGVLGTEAADGAGIVIGNSTTAYKNWAIRGSDTWAMGGWVCGVVDPNAGIAADYTAGSPTTTLQCFGWEALVSAGTAIGKGNPYGLDAIRYGRGALTSTAGDLANGYATFDGAAQYDNNSARRWGLVTPLNGAYYQQGLFIFGHTTASVNFQDANRAIFIQNTKKVASTFNTFEVRNTGSIVSLTAISFQALGTVSKGRWVTTDNATVTLTNCTFTDMDTFQFLSSGSLSNCTFRRCNTVIQSGSAIDGCLFDKPSGSNALESNNPSRITNCTFVGAGLATGSAIYIPPGASGTYNLTGNKYNSYSTASLGSNTTASSGATNASIYNNSGGAVTLNLISGDTPSIRNGAGSTTTVVIGKKTVTLTNLQQHTEVRVYLHGTTTALAGTTGVDFEDITAGSISFSVDSGQAIDIAICSLSYQDIWMSNFSTTTDTSIPIAQQFDRQYNNPP